MADVELSALSAASALAGTEKFPVLQTTAKAALISDVNTYVQTQLVAAGAGTASSGDSLLGFESTTIKAFTLDTVAAYAMTYAYAQAAATTPVLSTDTLIADRGGTKIEVSIDTITTYVSGVIAAAAASLATTIAALDAATDVSATDTFVFVTTGPTGKEITLANLEVRLWADFATATAALTNQGSIADSDIFYKVVGTTDYKTTATEIATYVQAEMFDAAAISSGNVLTGDTFLIKRGSDYKTVTGQHIADWVESEISSVLDISTLSAATIGDTDHMLIVQGTTPGREAASDVAAYVLGKFDSYLNALSAVSPATDSDEFYCLQGDVEKRMLASTIAAYTWAADQTAMKALTAKTTPIGADVLVIQDSANGDALKQTRIDEMFALYFNNMTEGAGITGATGMTCEHSIEKVGGLIKTTIVIDLTGLNSGGTDGDIIGKNGATDCHIGQITAALNGTIFAGRVTCLEVPTGGSDDIDLYAATESTGTEDTAIGDLAESALLTAGGAWSLMEVQPLTAFPAANKYLYLTGNTGDATYTAGILLIELWGK